MSRRENQHDLDHVRPSPIIVTGLVVLSIALLVGAANAQSLWLSRDSEKAVMLELLRPGLEFVEDRFATGAVFLSGRASMSATTTIVAEVPFAMAKGDYLIFLGSSEFSQATLGNIYLGLESHGQDSPFFGEFGVRVPIASEDDGVAGLAGELADLGRLNTFFPHVVSAQGAFNVRTVSEGGFVNRLRLGAALAASTEGGGAEVYGLYALQSGYEHEAFRIGLAASGTAVLSEDFGNLGSRALSQLELHADAGQQIRPGLDIKLPLGSAANLASVTVGLSLNVGFGEPISE